MKSISIIFSLFLLFSCSQPTDVVEDHSQNTETKVSDSLGLKATSQTVSDNIKNIIFRTDTIDTDSIPGWGYDIYIDNKRMIRQPHIPAVPGKITFPDKISAESVANLVIYKLKNNIMPPSVTIEELDSLGIEY